MQSDSDSSEGNYSDLFYAPVKEKKSTEILKSGYGNNAKGVGEQIVGDVNIFARDAHTEKLYIAHYYKKIMNIQNASLTHKSTNRALDNHDSNCCLGVRRNKKEYRFKKYFSKINGTNYHKIHHSMMSFKRMLDHGRKCLAQLNRIN